MSFDDTLFSIREMPPMRPVKTSKGVALVYPFYMYNLNNDVKNLAYSIIADISSGKITFKITGARSEFNIPVETPDTLLALTLRELYKLALSNNGEGSILGVLSCRDPVTTSSGFLMKGQITAVLFEGKPIDDPTIYLLAGRARSIEGSCQRTSQVTSGSFDISILYVKEAGSDSDRVCPSSLAVLSENQDSEKIEIEIIENTGARRLLLESDSLYCYPIYPPPQAKGNKFYPATLTVTISPSEYAGISYGAVFELLAGTIFVSPGGASGPGIDLIRGGRVEYYQSHFIPSPSLLSAIPGRRWHDNSLTVRAQDVPLLRLRFNTRLSNDDVNIAEKVRDIVKAQIIESLGSESPLSREGILEIAQNCVILPRRVLAKMLENLKDLKLNGETWKDLIAGLRSLKGSVGDVKLFQWTGLSTRPQKSSIHVDPKLIAKAVLNELVSYPIIHQCIGSTGSTEIRDEVFSKVTAIRYKRIATITGALANFLSGKATGNSEILYAHAWMNFTPTKILAAVYWALSKIAGFSLSNKDRPLRDTGLLLLSWALMAAAYAWRSSSRYRRRNNTLPWQPILLERLARSIGSFAVLAGVHGLAHLASQAMANALGISRPDLYVKELIRLYLEDTSYLMMRNQQRNQALLIDGALLISHRPSLLADLNVAIAQEGLYRVIREQHNIVDGLISNLGDLCQELYRTAGPYVGGTCMNVWKLSNRSYIVANHAAPPRLRNVAKFILDPFHLGDADMSKAYYPPPEVIVYLIEKQAEGEDLPSMDVKAYASQLAKARLPLCYDGCEMCVMCDECPLISSPVQQYMISRSGAYLLCSFLGANENL